MTVVRETEEAWPAAVRDGQASTLAATAVGCERERCGQRCHFGCEAAFGRSCVIFYVVEGQMKISLSSAQIC